MTYWDNINTLEPVSGHMNVFCEIKSEKYFEKILWGRSK